ncbi:MAG: PEP-CTERM sorting domain-containing protein, partial [Gemmatimonadaceae bacterium]
AGEEERRHPLHVAQPNIARHIGPGTTETLDLFKFARNVLRTAPTKGTLFGLPNLCKEGNMFRMRVLVSAVLLAVTSTQSGAQSFMMTMQGFLDSRSFISGPGALAFGTASPFTLTALFNTTTPNLVAPIGIPGFVAYTPSSVQMSVGGRTYAVQPFDLLHPTGLAVAIFDGTTPFAPPGRYGVGFIQNPLADGAGIVADFLGASPAYVLGSTGVVPASYTGFSGVGVASGVCTLGTPDNCLANAVTPIPMTFANQPYFLTLGNYDQDPSPGFSFSVSITAVPEPSTFVLLAAGMVAFAAFGRRRIRRS